MPRYEYRNLQPQPAAEKDFASWIEKLDEEFANCDGHDRSIVVRNALHELYLGRPYADPAPDASLAQRALVHSFDPRNTTDPIYFSDEVSGSYVPMDVALFEALEGGAIRL